MGLRALVVQSLQGYIQGYNYLKKYPRVLSAYSDELVALAESGELHPTPEQQRINVHDYNERLLESQNPKLTTPTTPRKKLKADRFTAADHMFSEILDLLKRRKVQSSN